MKSKNHHSSRGFTLLELVVVLSLFMLIMGVTVSIFVSIVRHQKRILSQQEVLSQISFVQEDFSRSLRSATVDVSGTCLAQDGVSHKGYVYLLTHFDLQTGFYQGVRFISREGICQELFLDSDGVLKEIKGSAVAQNIVSSKFAVKYARFIINGDKSLQAVLGQGVSQPRISMALGVQDPTYSDAKEIIIQTTVSHRNAGN